MAKIDTINFCFKENTAWMNNCDSSTDYFPNFSGSMKYIIERVKEYGADQIMTTTTNNSSKIPTERRVKQICKACGYKYTDKSHMTVYEGWDKIQYERFVYEFELIKI